LEKNPSNRYASAEAFADDLRRFLAGEPIHARPMGIWRRLWQRARRRPAHILGAVTLLILLLAGGWYLRVASQLSRHRAEDRYQTFVQRRDEALFYGLAATDQESSFLGAEPGANLQAADSAARDALRLAGVDPDSASPAVGASFTAQRRAEVAEDCYTLLLLL